MKFAGTEVLKKEKEIEAKIAELREAVKAADEDEDKKKSLNEPARRSNVSASSPPWVYKGIPREFSLMWKLGDAAFPQPEEGDFKMPFLYQEQIQ